MPPPYHHRYLPLPFFCDWGRLGPPQSGLHTLAHTSWIPYTLVDLDVDWMMETAELLVQGQGSCKELQGRRGHASLSLKRSCQKNSCELVFMSMTSRRLFTSRPAFPPPECV